MDDSISTTANHQSHSSEEIQNWLIEQVAERLEMDADEIDVHEPFDNYDLDSAQSLSMLGKLEQWLGHQFNPVLIFNYPTIAELANRLAEETKAS
jgi:acyl carrier protein